MDRITISKAALAKFPPMYKIMYMKRVTAMGGEEKAAVILFWREREQGYRLAAFCAETGEYISEVVTP